MPENEEFKHLVRRTALTTLSFIAGLVFGIILLVVDNDWIPGSIIVGASLVGLAAQVPAIRRLHRLRSEAQSLSPPRQKPAH
jgi:hypothetical protein